MTGAELIAQERERQIQEEGYDAAHDARLGQRDLIRAAEAYIAAEQGFDREARHRWPWDPEAFKPGPSNLVKAGALIAAAIDARRALDPIPDPGLMIEDAAETASDGGEL